ncbi:MAG: hypothetical protein LBJ64_08845, partial [Deltaproteobacteria bacterium]|nr:hypothetical protein [Deltaproteobacteria bacterium]
RPQTNKIQDEASFFRLDDGLLPRLQTNLIEGHVERARKPSLSGQKELAWSDFSGLTGLSGLAGLAGLAGLVGLTGLAGLAGLADRSGLIGLSCLSCFSGLSGWPSSFDFDLFLTFDLPTIV